MALLSLNKFGCVNFQVAISGGALVIKRVAQSTLLVAPAISYPDELFNVLSGFKIVQS